MDIERETKGEIESSNNEEECPKCGLSMNVRLVAGWSGGKKFVCPGCSNSSKKDNSKPISFFH